MREPVFEQQAQWYLALMYVKKKSYSNALQVLESIKNNADHFKSEETEELLSKIKN